jgi:type IV pilus assembly protein PilY1
MKGDSDMKSTRPMRIGAWMVIAVFGTNSVLAGTNVLADSPLVTGLSKSVKPNVMFILDDSTSMDGEFMPEYIPGTTTSLTTKSGSNCYKNFGFNTLSYNPNKTYTPPVNADGSLRPAGNIATAWDDGFAQTGSVNLAPTNNTGLITVPGGPFVIGTSNPITTLSTSNKKVTVTIGSYTVGGHVLGVGDLVTFTNVDGSGSPKKIGGIPITAFNGQTYAITGFTAGGKINLTISGSPNNATSLSSGGGGAVTLSYQYSGVVSTTPNPAADYYEYTANVSPNTSTSPPNTCVANASYTKRNPAADTYMTRTVAQELTNYANWYSYYRNRLLMMKTASGRAFSALTDKYRVGFTATSESGTSNKFLGVKAFDATQRQDWYDELYTMGNLKAGTPLRGALSKAGRYFAGKLVTGNDDPVQYSCQQNYAILATDGFWNMYFESSSPKYGPYREDNSTLVGDQDSGATVPRPYKDSLAKSNTLADVAYYYYNTDLRTSGTGGLTDEGTNIDVTANNVPTTASDPASHQHMTTYTMGLGLADVLSYPADYTNLVQGTKNWPDPKVSDTTTIAVSGRVDDLWHAGVNGHGDFLSATDPGAVEAQLGAVLRAIQATTGSAAAAATSNLQPVSGDDTAFIAQYRTGEWVGDLVARNIDVVTGAISTTNIWSAQAKLDAMVAAAADSRTIYTFDGAATNKLKTFVPANLVTEKSAGYFDSDQLTQYSAWTAAQKTAATNDTVINFLRGQTGNQDKGTALTTDLYRARPHTMGDIGSAAPVYIRKSPFGYTDAGYATYLAGTASRAPTVYVGGNDGMLHAIDATTGQANSGKERWAYIPKLVVPNLYRLADGDYSNNHRFFVDGPITAGDAYSGSSWSTLLVGGLGHGGRGFYALDVSDPANPTALWEFGTAQDADVGYSYGAPLITKRASDDKWVVILASGYNNSSPGDGKGRIFVLDAFTGAKLSEIITDNSVTDEERSGIARISNYVENGLVNNATQYVYGGDLDGALWRFDINTNTSQLLGRTAAAGTRTQPITVQPELGKIRDGAGTWHRVVYFGTGRYLGPNDVTNSDPSNSEAQGIYAVKDTGASLGILSATPATLVSQTLDSSSSPRKINPIKAVDWQTDNGWYVTTPVSERFNVDPGLQLGVLVMAANIPEQGYCNPTGRSVLYQLDYKSGNVLKTSEYQAQIVGNTQVQLGGPGGAVFVELVFGTGQTGGTAQPPPPPGAGGITRVGWREIE